MYDYFDGFKNANDASYCIINQIKFWKPKNMNIIKTLIHFYKKDVNLNSPKQKVKKNI